MYASFEPRSAIVSSLTLLPVAYWIQKAARSIERAGQTPGRNVIEAGGEVLCHKGGKRRHNLASRQAFSSRGSTSARGLQQKVKYGFETKFHAGDLAEDMQVNCVNAVMGY